MAVSGMGSYVHVCVCVCVWEGECIPLGVGVGVVRTTLVRSGQDTTFSDCRSITNLGARFSSSQFSHPPQEAAKVGQDLRFFSLKPLETHSSGEHRTQTKEIKSHLVPQRHKGGGY